jgi:hypothetical protein
MSGRNQGYYDDFSTINYNTNTSHPLIPNSQEYIYYKKYVSIHSEDRNILKYPNSGEFEIEFPEDLLNVVALRLISWAFPSNYNTFSLLNENVNMTFKINNPYDPSLNGITDFLSNKIFEFLSINKNNNYAIIIQEGFYNPQQMVTELTNKFNNIVTIEIQLYFNSKINDPSLPPTERDKYKAALISFTESGGYTNFIITYNSVSQKIWFGNISDGFILTNETQFAKKIALDSYNCATKQQSPDYSDWGLPGNIGLPQNNVISVNGLNAGNFTESALYNGIIVPRFYYGDVYSGDNGYWLLPDSNLPNSQVYWIESTYKINLMGPAYIYMDLEGQNCIDETQPFNVSDFTVKTNGTNGVVNASFAKMAIPTTPISQWFDRDSLPYKFYYPPAEKMRRFKFKLRYHNGQVVNFGVFNYSFVIEFTLQLPQILRNSKSVSYPPPLGR